MKLTKDATVAANLLKELAPGILEEDVQEFLSLYQEPWRTYHNLPHPLKLLTILDRQMTGLHVGDLRLLSLMILYHDVVYKLNQTKGWNETASADLMRKQLLSAGCYSRDIDFIYHGILATINHNLDDVPEEIKHVVIWLIDLDLFVGMGASAEDFQANTDAIRVEYSPVYTSQEYDAGRAKWAASMLEKETIYHTAPFKKYEAVARSELTKLL